MRSNTTASSTAWVLALTGIGSLMAALDTLVVATALPSIRLDLGASVAGLEWTVNAYNLSFAVLLITAAALGDRFGRRRLFAAGLVVFALTSAACALAPDVGWLIAGRALQGIGAALIMPLALALLTAAFPPEKRGAAIGIFSAITGLAVASGPLVGGAVVEGFDWSWVFWLNVPIGLLAAPLVLRKMDESFGADTELDGRGLALVTLGALGIVWGLVRGNAAGWTSPEVLATLSLGAVLIVAFVAWELRAPQPMLPMRFFGSRSFSAGNAAMFCVFASLFGAVFFFSQLMQNGLGYGPLDAGLRLLPWTGTFLVFAPLAGALTDKVGERPLMVGGLLVQAAGMLWIATLTDPGVAYGELVVPLVVTGIGISFAIPSAQNSVVGSVAADAIGKAAGTNSMMRELGGVFGIAAAVAVFAEAGSYASPVNFLDGFTPAILVTASFALLGALSGTQLPGRAGRMVVNHAGRGRARSRRGHRRSDQLDACRGARQMNPHQRIGSRDEWLLARRDLLEQEKALTRLRDELARQRRALPWVLVDKDYRFDTETGRRTLAELGVFKWQRLQLRLRRLVHARAADKRRRVQPPARRPIQRGAARTQRLRPRRRPRLPHLLLLRARARRRQRHLPAPRPGA